MIEIKGINIAESVRKNSLCHKCSQLPIERWEEIMFDVDLGEDMMFRDLIEEFGAEALIPNIRERLVFDMHNNIEMSFYSVGENRVNVGLFDRMLKERGSNRVRVLSAHGGPLFGKEYAFEKGRPKFPIRNWIEEHSRDSKGYGAIFISSCNSAGYMPVFEGVPIFYSKGVHGTPGIGKTYLVTCPNDIRAYIENICVSLRTLGKALRNNEDYQLWGI
jgi:hypothetical protein